MLILSSGHKDYPPGWRTLHLRLQAISASRHLRRYSLYSWEEVPPCLTPGLNTGQAGGNSILAKSARASLYLTHAMRTESSRRAESIPGLKHLVWKCQTLSATQSWIFWPWRDEKLSQPCWDSKHSGVQIFETCLSCIKQEGKNNLNRFLIYSLTFFLRTKAFLKIF